MPRWRSRPWPVRPRSCSASSTTATRRCGWSWPNAGPRRRTSFGASPRRTSSGLCTCRCWGRRCGSGLPASGRPGWSRSPAGCWACGCCSASRRGLWERARRCARRACSRSRRCTSRPAPARRRRRCSSRCSSLPSTACSPRERAVRHRRRALCPGPPRRSWRAEAPGPGAARSRLRPCCSARRASSATTAGCTCPSSAGCCSSTGARGGARSSTSFGSAPCPRSRRRSGCGRTTVSAARWRRCATSISTTAASPRWGSAGTVRSDTGSTASCTGPRRC